MANVGPVGSMFNTNNQMMPQQLYPTGVASSKHKAAMKRKAVAAGMEISVKKAKKYGAGAKALLLKSMKVTRPLNSWIAYRSYYSRLFVDIQQKDISSILRVLWEIDPFKGKWQILAKAFSVIRDVKGKKDASLDPFLAISAPFIGIVRTAIYLPLLGFQVTVDGKNQVFLRRDPNFAASEIDPDMIKTNISVEDVVEQCYRQGYFTDNNNATAVPHNTQGTMIMATTTPMIMATTTPMPAGPVPQQQQSSTDGEEQEADEATQGDKQGTLQQVSVFGNQIADSGTSTGHPATETANAVPELDLETVTQSFGEYPYNAAFDPNATDNYYFDPFGGYAFDAVDMDDLDNFNMNDWVQEEAYEEDQ